MKFRKKPVKYCNKCKRYIVIEAEQFISMEINEETIRIIPEGVYVDSTSKTGFSIDTLEGKHEVTLGDWIITGIKGEKYPVKDEIFKLTYDRVDE